MLLTIIRLVKVNVTHARLVLPVNYEEGDMPYDYPHRDGDKWSIVVDIATGQIQDWPKGTHPLNLYMEVVDQGQYRLLDDKGATVREVLDDYVPSWIPGDYGDYVKFDIDANGKIANWPKDKATFQRAVNGKDDD